MDDILKRAYSRYIELDDEAWELIRLKWKLHQVSKGDFLISAGESENFFYVVIKGVQRLYFESGAEEHTLGFSYDGSWSGGYSAFISRQPSEFSVEALSDSSFWRISHKDYILLFDELPILNKWGRLILEELLMQRSIREREMMSMSAEERYVQLMNRSRHLLQLVPQKHIASYLKMTPETFSRLRKKGL